MKIKLMVVHHNKHTAFDALVAEYDKRINGFTSFEEVVVQLPKKMRSKSPELQKNEEGKLILDRMKPTDHIVLLDELGKQYTSVDFSRKLEKSFVASIRRIVFVIGGPYGFSDAVKSRSNEMMSLSKLTFAHQLARLVFVEQLYRALSILKNMPYHHA